MPRAGPGSLAIICSWMPSLGLQPDAPAGSAVLAAGKIEWGTALNWMTISEQRYGIRLPVRR